MSERTCETCGHWKRNPGGWLGFPRFFEPEVDGEAYAGRSARREAWEAGAQNLFGRCGGIPFAPEGEIPLAFTIDGSEYAANLYTQAEFGCLLWAAVT